MRRYQLLALTLCAGLGILDAQASGSADELVYIATFKFKPAGQTDASPAEPQGIVGARLDVKTGHLTSLGLAVELKRASWLVTHPTLPIVYSVAQSAALGSDSDSVVLGFAIDRVSGTLKEINRVDAHGRDATHMVLDAASHTLLVANHGTGNVSALPLLTDGRLEAMKSDQTDYGSGPTPRQKSPAPHGVAVDPSHRFITVADFGADRVFVYRFDPVARTLTPAPTPFEQLPPGSGPRRVVFHPDGRFLYVANELTGEVSWFQWNAHNGQLRLAGSLSPYPGDYTGQKSAAEIAFSHDGRYFYLSLRGDREALITYSVDKISGGLTERQRISPPGKIPWSFGIDPTGHWMLVADQGSNSVDVLAIDSKTGQLLATKETVSAPSPVAVTFYRP